MSQADDIALAHALADAAGAAIRPFFRAPYEIDTKSDASPVTEADKAGELAMRALIEQTYPGDGIIDAHYLYRQNPDVKHQYGCFLETYVRDGVPTVPGPGAITDPCP